MRNYLGGILAFVACLSQAAVLPSDGIEQRSFADGIRLRIMPLGASITYGLKSTDGNGYRKDLRVKLIDNGNPVNYVGTQISGTMLDNNTEGWPGYTITEVHNKANVAVPKYKPNVILVNVGTNDVSGNVDISAAGERMTSLLDDLYAKSPRATVILSTLLVRADATMQLRTVSINSQIKTVAAAQQAKNRRLVLVDMESSSGPVVGDLVDGVHPDDAGYVKMANIWFDGIKTANAKGFLVAPEFSENV
ncbi:carbohydrate esterase family 3 protein [Xylariaceae sp. FL1019]|nr:carbohydrate esterase family 3 protein [Xylariaceae sp. FL1019]